MMLRAHLTFGDTAGMASSGGHAALAGDTHEGLDAGFRRSANAHSLVQADQ